ncbi:MAG: nucleoside-diphosphate sugar epimerase/dehydratase [Terriglobia bacterium]|jgi:FlaA1/EpsC-like NDP-sugar epimerase
MKPGIYTRTNKVIIDACIFSISFFIAYLIRFEGLPPWAALKQFLLWFPYLVATRVYVNWKLGIYRSIWRYVSLPDAISMARSMSIVSAFLLVLRFLYPISVPFAFWLHVPLSVIVLEYCLSLGGCMGVRALRRLRYQGGGNGNGSSAKSTRILLVGAGQAGVRLAKEMEANPQVELVGFLDDDFRKVGAVINGVRVLGPTSFMATAVKEHNVDQVVIAITRPPRSTLKRLWALSEHLSVEMKIIPTLEEILHGKLNIAAFREVQMDDLLGRETVDLSVGAAQVDAAYQGTRILITGAGGSIGSELAHQLFNLKAERLILFDKDENGLHDVAGHLSAGAAGPEIHPVVADIRFRERLRAVFSEFRPDIVFHAAAHKHVPLMELNPCEAVLNNVIGTRNLVEESQAAGVSRFIFISTDKAVKPLSVMGATKRVGELIVQAHSRNGQATSFACVRFGNVMGSRGSVIPLFQKQILRGGPLTLTHPDMKRYMMTIPEAVRLVIQAGALASSGEIFVLDMGDPVPIVDLANDLIELSGLRPGKDIQIEVTQLRPGEKLTEELFDPDTETASPTQFEKIWVVRPRALHFAAFQEKLAALEHAATRNASQEVQRLLPEFNRCFESSVVRTAGAE